MLFRSPRLSPQVLDGPVCIGGLTFTPVPVKHGILDILGWEVGENVFPPENGNRFLYLTDTSAIPPSSLERLQSSNGTGRRVIIIGGLRVRPHETHFTFQEALNAAIGLGAKEVYLTHLTHEHSHAEIEAFCRQFMESQRDSGGSLGEVVIHPAWDGLEIRL